jgi:hypothetical protein
MPTATDLVTDLPADFEVFGQAVATSMADLLGGTSGQVLAKNSNTDMDFVWVTSDDANAIQNTIVDAKGDLIGATAADTPARLAVGTNGQVLTADSTAATGLAWATASSGSTNMAGKNGVINSNFSVWQRGTSVSVAASTVAYTADRLSLSTAASQASTVSRQVTGDTTNLPNIQYCARIQRNSGQTGTGTMYLANSFETIDSIPFTGKAVTVSFYARKGANYSPTASALNLYLWNGTGTDQNVNTGYTGANVVGSVTATLTTTWQRFTFTATVPTNSTEIALQYQSVPTGTAGVNDYYEITGIQVEIASSATAYSPNTSTYQAELAACQRYYWRFTNTTVNPSYLGIGTYYSSTSCYMVLQWPVTMRTAATVATSSQTGWLTQAGSQRTSTAWAVDVASNSYADIYITTSSATTGIGAVMGLLGSSNNWIEASAEL